MDYKKWSEEYLESAERLGAAIKKLNIKRRRARQAERKEIDSKISVLRRCRCECLETAELLLNRYLGVA